MKDDTGAFSEPQDALEKSKKITDINTARARAEKEAYQKQPSGDPPSNLPEIPTWSDVSVGRFLAEQPPRREYIFDELLPAGIVGFIHASGGTGKSFLLLELACALATGKKFGPFKPVRDFSVLYMGAEDVDDELHRRVYAIRNVLDIKNTDLLSRNMAAMSTFGQLGPFLAKSPGGNIDHTPAYTDWLLPTMDTLRPDVLMIDPMSRFFGLEENDSADATAWVQCLERVARIYGATVLFAHHESKAASKNKDPRDNSGRGSSGFKDGVRWSAGLSLMADSVGDDLDVNARDYVVFDISKTNYSATLPAEIYFERGPAGVLIPASLNRNRIADIADMLCKLLAESGQELTARDLKQEQAGSEIAAALKKRFQGKFKRKKDMPFVIDYALSKGMLKTSVTVSGPTSQPKNILVVT